jgi:uncharacterized protein YabE (DUF348 family)
MRLLPNQPANPFQREPNKVQRIFAEQQQVHAPRFKKLRAHPLMVPVVTFLALFVFSALLITVINHREKPVPDAFVVILKHDGSTQTIPSREPNVGALLKKLNITLHEGDVVEPAATAPINQEDFRINVYRAVPVQIVDNGHITFSFSAATTPRSIAEQTGITTYAEDELETQPISNFVTQGAIGEQVIIKRATPINLLLFGTNTTARTRATTVADLIKEKGIKLTKDDVVTPALTTPITPNMGVSIVRNGIVTQTATETIPAPNQIIQDASLAIGTTAVRQAGAPGEQVITYEVKTENGQVVSRTAIHTVVTRQPVAQIVVQGTSLSGIKGNMALAGISPADFGYVDYIVDHESHWNPLAQNASGAYGLCQALPGSKMASAGADWANNPVTQLRWCNGYAVGRYGSWAAAYNYWVSHRYW